jgi:site-specific recombinase XerC
VDRRTVIQGTERVSGHHYLFGAAAILDDAVRDRMLAANPARGVSLPRRTRRPNVYLTVEQLRRLAVESGHYGSLILLLGVAGLRWGEAAALRMRDVDFLRRGVLLHENAVAVGGRTHVGTLQSGHHRSLALPAFVVDELAATCAGKDHDGLIWPGRDGGYLAPPTKSHGRPVRWNGASRPTRLSRG